jgi:hypothetical protein
MNLNGIQNLILHRSFDQMTLQACVVHDLRNLWIPKVLSLWTLKILVKSFCRHRKVCLTSSFWLDGRIDPDRSVAYRTTRVLGHRLILERGRHSFWFRELRDPLLCDEAYERRPT